MIIAKTPFRMSFFGGGTDMPEFFNRFGGSVISTSFDKYCYTTVRHLPPFFDYHSEVAYSKIERVTESADLEHPLVRNAMKYLDIRDIRLTYEADLPARSGLGTSSSFAVGMLNAFHRLKGKTADSKQLADEAIYVERVLCGEAGGWQDQIAAAFGGFNRINFSSDSYEVIPLDIAAEKKKKLNDNLMLFFTGFTRISADIQKEAKPVSEKEKELCQMLALVDDAQRILTDGDPDDFGRLLDVTWKLKRQTGSNISTSRIDMYYEKALKAGASGGKLLGAGGGGFLLFYVPRERRKEVFDAMSDLLYIPFEFTDKGSEIIYETAETYSFRE
ncbi:MAG: kinase [Lachnospiraceae bacterium]|nr:kinase [Candidatus Darwinimomas equi]